MISADAIRGYIDLMVLALLRERPSYAYELARQIGEVSGGAYAVKQTTLYTAVKRLETAGFVTSYSALSDSAKPRTYYRISATGLAHLDLKVAEWHATKSVVDNFIARAEGIAS